MIFKKSNKMKGNSGVQDTNNIDVVHSKLIDETEFVEFEDVGDGSLDFEIDFDPEYEGLEVDESVELEEVSEDVEDDLSDDELTLEDLSDDEDTELTLEEVSDETDSANDDDGSGVPNFAKRWALVLSMAAAAVIIGVSSVAVVTVRQKRSVTKVDAATTQQETTTERFLLLTEDYKNVDYKNIILEVLPEDTTITVNILNAESEPYTGVLFKAVAVKGVVDDNRDFLNEVVTHEQVEDFDTSDTVPFVQVNDDDLDGTIVFENLDEDDYTIALLSASGYNPVEPVEVSTIKYEIIDDIIEQVAAESEETIKEDPENNRNIAVETPSTSAATTTVVATTAASTTEETKQVEVYTVKTVNDEIVYDVSYGSTMELSESELAKYDAVSVYVSSGGSYATQTGYVLSTGSRKIGDDTISYISQILVPVGDVNVSLIDGLQFEMSEVMDTTSTAAPSSSGSDASRETTTTAAAGNTTSTAAPSTTAGSTTATTAATTADSTTTGNSQSTTEGTTAETQPTTTQPATTAAAKKTYRVLNLEPVVETGTKSVYSDGWHTINGSKYYYSNGKAYTGWNEIDGIQYYFSSTGVLSSKTVIDVSRYNGTIDWNAVKASGIDYAIIRVGYRGYGSGTLTWDSTFDTNMQGAIAAGIKVGAYIVTQAVNTTEAVEEASFIVNACSKYSISLPLVIDVESAGGGSGRGDQISVSTRTAVINAFAQTVRSAGYTPMVYASKTWLEGRINSGSISSYCKVWIARYNDTLGYSGRYNMWQFRSDGSVSGIGGNVDISAWIN